MLTLKEEGQYASIVGILIAVVLVVIGINSGINQEGGQIFGVIGVFFAIFSVAGLKWPESAGHLLAIMFKNMADGSKSNKSNKGSKSNVKQKIYNYGTMSNSIGDGNTVETNKSKTTKTD